MVEAAALLHDIALAHVEQRRDHGKVGAEMAEQFLAENQLFESEAIVEIVHAIRWHDSVKPDDSPLLAILRDADMLEIFGAIGLMRGLTSKATLPDYDPSNIRGETWELTARDFDMRFANGTGIGPTIMDQLNFQISCYDNLNTATARHIAQPLVAFMRAFLNQLASEIEHVGET
jgi:HD superfamily phosphodiesterase